MSPWSAWYNTRGAKANINPIPRNNIMLIILVLLIGFRKIIYNRSIIGAIPICSIAIISVLNIMWYAAIPVSMIRAIIIVDKDDIKSTDIFSFLSSISAIRTPKPRNIPLGCLKPKQSPVINPSSKMRPVVFGNSVSINTQQNAKNRAYQLGDGSRN